MFSGGRHLSSIPFPSLVERESSHCRWSVGIPSRVIVLLFLLPLDLHAQVRVHRFSNIGVEQGLSHFRCYDLIQDHIGYLWVATKDGLNRYDGYHFNVFKHDESDSSSVSDNLITAVCEDSQGNIIVGTQAGVLQRFIRSTETFEPLTKKMFTRSNTPGPIRFIYKDPSGCLWVGVPGNGLYEIRRQNESSDNQSAEQQVIHYVKNDRSLKSLSSNFVYSVFMDRAGVMWACTDNGLDALPPGAAEFKQYKHSPNDLNTIVSNTVISAFEDDVGVLWIGTDEGLDQMDQYRTHVAHYRHSASDKTSLSQDFVTSICGQDKRYLWVGTLGGLNKLDRLTGEFERFLHDPRDPNSLVNDYVVKILKDAEGNLWMATDRGLSKNDPRTDQFGYYRIDPDIFGPQSVTAILVDREGFLWLGTDYGIRRVDRMLHPVLKPRSAQSKGSLYGSYIQSIIQDKTGVIWVGTNDGGLNRYNKDGTFDHYLWSTTRASDAVLSMCEDKDGDLWIGTTGEGLLRFNPEKKRFECFNHDPRVPGSLSNNKVECVLIDRSNILWAGTGGGLDRLDLSAMSNAPLSFVHFRHAGSLTESISNDRVSALCEGREGLLVATNIGLDLLDAQSNTFQHLLVNGQSFSGSILRIFEDDHGNLWLSTMQDGLYRLDPSTGELEQFDDEDGLQGKRFYYGAAKSKSGKLLFGGENGFNIFHPDSIRRSVDHPFTVLTGFKVYDKPLNINTYAQEPTVDLNYDQNFFAFEFAALDLTSPSKNHYMYMLDGLDRDWVRVGTRRTASYTNIDPGRYSFRVRGSNRDGVWSDKELAIAVVVKPPYWATWWFRTLLAASVISFLAGLYRYRVNRLLEIQRLRSSIASDLHDDIGSSLGSIALASDMIQSSRRLPKETRDQLVEIGAAARSTAETLRNIVWVLSPSYDTVEKLVLKLKDEAAMMLRGIEYSFRFVPSEKDVFLPMEIRRNIILVYKESLYNIARHANATLVDISIEAEQHQVHLRIADNGKGFDKLAKYNGNGMKNLVNRGEKLGKIKIRSEIGKGTEIRLTAKIP